MKLSNAITVLSFIIVLFFSISTLITYLTTQTLRNEIQEVRKEFIEQEARTKEYNMSRSINWKKHIIERDVDDRTKQFEQDLLNLKQKYNFFLLEYTITNSESYNKFRIL